MQNSAVSGVAIGTSDDDPLEPALIVHVKSALQLPVPHQAGGVRTKVVFDQPWAARVEVPNAEVARATQAKAQHSAELMSNSRVFGVGVGLSKDSPGEAAIVIYVDRNSTLAVPAEIGGTRTQIVRTDPFRTSRWGKQVQSVCSKPSSNLGSALHTDMQPGSHY